MKKLLIYYTLQALRVKFEKKTHHFILNSKEGDSGSTYAQGTKPWSFLMYAFQMV